MAKVRLPGTHRAVPPEVSWSRIAPRLRDYGITRVADVTRLDNIGIPVFLAVRPESETLAVAQGKGMTPLLAKLSAVMESVELWHAERPAIDPFMATAPELDLPYRLDELNLGDVGRWLDQLRLSWVWARPAAGGPEVAVPIDVVRLSYSGDHFSRPRIFQTSSTGLASGNTYAEACLHGLYEAIERDVLATVPSRHDPARLAVDPTTIPHDHVRSLLERISAAGVECEVTCIPNRFGVPTFAAAVWSPLFPIVCAGSGSHLEPGVAVSRAITEAVQTRLTEISATRDDIQSDLDLARDSSPTAGFRADGPFVAFADAVGDQRADFDDLTAELDAVSERIRAAVGREPLAVVLSADADPMTVVRVVCPGVLFAEGRMISSGSRRRSPTRRSRT